MMSIHELAKLSGVSVRTIHYYDQIDMLKPCAIEPNGYRKYDRGSLERLQQIMFYKEMDLPLKRIKVIMSKPQSDPKAVIRGQKDVLEAKRKRLGRLIERMEHILKGEEDMDFGVFKHHELEELLRSRLSQLEPQLRQALIAEYGGMEACLEELMRNEAAIIEIAVKDYGSLGGYIASLKAEPLPDTNAGKLQIRLDGIVGQIAAYKGREISDPQVQELVEEWKCTAHQIFHSEDISPLFKQIYTGYMHGKETGTIIDTRHGKGAAVFVGRAMEYNALS